MPTARTPAAVMALIIATSIHRHSGGAKDRGDAVTADYQDSPWPDIRLSSHLLPRNNTTEDIWISEDIRRAYQPSLAPRAGANYIQGGDADVSCTAWFRITTLLGVVIHMCRRHAAPTQAQVRLHWTTWRPDLSSVNYRMSCLSCCWSKGVEWPAKRSYLGLVAVGVQEQAEDILVPPLLRNCLTSIAFPFPSHYLPPQTSNPCNSFYCLGQFKNVHDDDDDDLSIRKSVCQWPKWCSHCKDHYLADVSRWCQDITAWMRNVLTVDGRLTIFTATHRSFGWLRSRVVIVLDSGAVGPGFKSQPWRCRVTVLGKLFTPIEPLFTKQQNWQQPSSGLRG